MFLNCFYIMGNLIENSFVNFEIGKGLKNGDNITIEVCKPDGNNRNGVYHSGIIIYENFAFSLKIKRNEDTFDIIPLCNYASYCKITKTKSAEASKVLQLMDKDFSYCDALEIVLSENKVIDKELLEIELDKYI